MSPFVGKAGRLLTDIIEKGVGLRRSDVYIANVRQSAVRRATVIPNLTRLLLASPFCAGRSRLVQPQVLVTLGTFATQAVLRNRIPISRQRGQWSSYQGVAVMPTFHPAYLLRTPSGKREVWSDIQQVMSRLGMELPQRRGRS